MINGSWNCEINISMPWKTIRIQSIESKKVGIPRKNLNFDYKVKILRNNKNYQCKLSIPRNKIRILREKRRHCDIKLSVPTKTILFK